MQTWFDCIPCFARQAVEAVRIVTDDEARQEELLRAILTELSTMDLTQSPPVMAQRVHALLRERTGGIDPYAEAKRAHNALAMRLLPQLRPNVESAERPFEAAVRLACSGNLIDMGVGMELDEARIHRAIDEALHVPLHGDVDRLARATSEAERILYLTDNAGEIVFDQLLLERLPLDRVTVAVKGAPIINDATMDDARETGLTEMARVIDNGFDAPGTVLERCGEEFLRAWDEADIVIAKGQGNYETLSDAPKHRFHLLTIKCAVVAQAIGEPRGALTVHESGVGAAR